MNKIKAKESGSKQQTEQAPQMFCGVLSGTNTAKII